MEVQVMELILDIRSVFTLIASLYEQFIRMKANQNRCKYLVRRVEFLESIILEGHVREEDLKDRLLTLIIMDLQETLKEAAKLVKKQGDTNLLKRAFKTITLEHKLNDINSRLSDASMHLCLSLLFEQRERLKTPEKGIVKKDMEADKQKSHTGLSVTAMGLDIGSVLSLIESLHKQANRMKANKEQCKWLVSRVQVLKSIILRVREEDLKDDVEATILGLQETLKEAEELLQKEADTNPLQRALRSSSLAHELNDINSRLTDASHQLSLSLHLMQCMVLKDLGDMVADKQNLQGGQDAAAFLMRNRPKLIQRVYDVMFIADQLFDQEVIGLETFANIQAAATSQDKMRYMLDGVFSAGAQGKLAFYRILQENHPSLVEELWTASPQLRSLLKS